MKSSRSRKQSELQHTSRRGTGGSAGPPFLLFAAETHTVKRGHEGEHKVRPYGWPMFFPIISSSHHLFISSSLHLIISAVLSIAVITVLPRPCLAVQPQEWEITKEDYFQQLAGRLEGLAGDDWQVSLHFADKIRGWDGTTLGRIVRFEHRTMKVKVLDKDLPASFNLILADIRETVTSESRLRLKDDAEQSDECLGSDGAYLWFCSPGPYAAAMPDKWQALVRNIRSQFTIPQPAGGVQCRIDLAKNIFAAGEPIELRASVRNVSGRPIVAANPLKSDALVVHSIDSPADVPAADSWRSGTGGAIQPWDELVQTIDLRRSYGIRKPGRFTVSIRYRLNDESAPVESQQVNVRVVPDDFLALRIKRSDGKDSFKRGDKIMVDLVLMKGYDDTENLSDLKITFRADPRGGGIASGLRGWPGNDPGETRKEQVPVPASLQMGKGSDSFRYDLGIAKWARTVGSPAMRVTLWDYTQLGEHWEIRAECSGKAGGDGFHLISNFVRVRILKDQRR